MHRTDNDIIQETRTVGGHKRQCFRVRRSGSDDATRELLLSPTWLIAHNITTTADTLHFSSSSMFLSPRIFPSRLSLLIIETSFCPVTVHTHTRARVNRQVNYIISRRRRRHRRSPVHRHLFRVSHDSWKNANIHVHKKCAVCTQSHFATVTLVNNQKKKIPYKPAVYHYKHTRTHTHTLWTRM